MQSNGMIRQRAFVPPQSNGAFKTRTPAFLGGSGKVRDAGSVGLQAAIQGPLGERAGRGTPFKTVRRDVATTANAQANQQIQNTSQMLSNSNQRVSRISTNPYRTRMRGFYGGR